MNLKEIFPIATKAIKESDTKRLLELFDSNPGSIELLTPFGSWMHYAARNSTVNTLQTLVDLGLSPEIRVDPEEGDKLFENGESPIVAAARGGILENVKFFLRYEVRLDTHDPSVNPLFGAIVGCSVEIVHLLIEAGIDTTVRYSGEMMNDMDALAFALERGETEIADVLALHASGGDESKAAALKAERDGKGRHGRPPVPDSLAPPSEKKTNPEQ